MILIFFCLLSTTTADYIKWNFEESCYEGDYIVHIEKQWVDPGDPWWYNEWERHTCRHCPDGYITDMRGADFCHLCTRDFHPDSFSNSANTLCILCDAGKYKADSWAGPYCNSCPGGQYQPEYGQTSCHACPQGFSTMDYQAHEPKLNCEQCAPYQYSTTGSASCTACDANSNKVVNYYRNGCETCTLGQEVSGNTPIPYTTTSYDHHERTYCQNCPPGQKGISIDGINTCERCTPGKYAHHSGETQCTQCPAGEFQDGYWGTACKNCPYGQYNTGLANTGCTLCEVGKFQTLQRKTSCDPCPAGSWMPLTGSAEENCYGCPEGWFSEGLENIACISCEVGKFQKWKRQTSCDPCPAGSWMPTRGSPTENCNYCPEGWEQPQLQSTACTQCLAGKYAWSTRNAECKQCDDGQMSIDYEHYGFGECAGGYDILQEHLADATTNTGTWGEKVEKCSKACRIQPSWQLCAFENGLCNCHGARARFGNGDSNVWTGKTFNGEFSCSIE